MSGFGTSEFSTKYPVTNKLTESLIGKYPDQKSFLTRRFSSLEPEEERNLEYFSDQIIRLVGDDLDQFLDDYIFICNMQTEEEFYFRRNNNQYRLSKFQDAVEQVYSNKPFMASYMNGLLMTQIWWSNHTKMLAFYKEEFLPKNIASYRHLEIGPGHGKLLSMACQDERAGEVAAWDISPASIESTKHALQALGVKRIPELKLVDMFSSEPTTVDSLVFSEVLEHMENPEEALSVLQSCLSDEGRLFIHVPINSPAPDHLFNKATPTEMKDFIESQGFEITDYKYAPLTNYSLERAIEQELTISCGFIAVKK